jgi:hypothetical protein
MKLRSRLDGRQWKKVLAASAAGACLGVGGLVAPMLASAAGTTPKLNIKPSALYYPCSEGTVTFSVVGFPATTQVALRLGSVKATALRTIETNANGGGKVTVTFTNQYQGYYSFFATTTSATARHLLTIGVCP